MGDRVLIIRLPKCSLVARWPAMSKATVSSPLGSCFLFI
jgi:hypothetical protein